jgi:hypothetical protein
MRQTGVELLKVPVPADAEALKYNGYLRRVPTFSRVAISGPGPGWANEGRPDPRGLLEVGDPDEIITQSVVAQMVVAIFVRPPRDSTFQAISAV